MREYINPLNLPYKYQHYNGHAHREAADPTLLLFKGKYYIFASMSGGFYYSDDLTEWKWHENRDLDLYRYAPDAHVLGDSVIFCASDRTENCTFRRTRDPLSDVFEDVSSPFPFWDPALFVDDDGRVFFYWGCACGKPIYGVELDRDTLTPIGETKELIFGHPELHGWERRIYPGMPPQPRTPDILALYEQLRAQGLSDDAPFIEGAYMNKIGGRYYLQYAGPATELAPYGDGVYVGENPLGPFIYQGLFSSVPGGFITAAGHGSTIADKYGNLWHIASMRISVNASFERRLGLFPAGVDTDGVMYCAQAFADWPISYPDGKFDPLALSPRWMLLSYGKRGTASSTVPGHEPSLALDEDITTAWCADGSAGEWFRLDLGRQYGIHAVQVSFADVDVPLLSLSPAQAAQAKAAGRYIDTDPALRTRWILEGSADGAAWNILCDKANAETDLADDYIPVDTSARYLRITAVSLPYGKKFALSGLRVFGDTAGDPPHPVKALRARRVDAMTVRLSWAPVPGATGCLIRYGKAEDKLYLSHMVYGRHEVLLTTLDAGQTLWVRADSFGEGGITQGAVENIRV